MVNDNPIKSVRPISPHLSIYRRQISSVLSIMHRLTGIILFASLLTASWIFIFWSFGCNFLAKIPFSDKIFKTLLILISFMFFYHLSNGLRHLLWDSGRGFSIKSINITGWLAIIFSIVCTIIFWIFI